MVKLPKEEASAPTQREASYRSERNRNLFLHNGPAGLIELEEFADMAANYMRTISNDPNVHQTAMNRLRQLFNLEFKLRCNVCGTAHNQDEITAPER